MSTPAALGDLRILDFSRVLAGPFATMMLADLGAEVIKIERPGTGDETRSWGPPFDARGRSTYFESVNRNKQSVVLDLSTDEGLARARELAAGCDVIVENFRPGVMGSIGLDYETISAADPRLIYCSITGFGDGDGARLPGFDLLVQALGGLMSITGAADGEPQKVGVAVVDVLTGLFASIGILAALRHRDSTGEGQRVKLDLFSCLLAGLVNQGSAFTVGGVVPHRMGNAHPSVNPYALFPTGDGELILAVGNDRQFAALCDELGVPTLSSDPRFATNSNRVTNSDALRALLIEALAARPATEWAPTLIDRRVPAGVVNDVAAAFALAESIGLNPIVEVPGATDGGTVALTRNPIELSRTPPTYRSAPPPLGGGGSDSSDHSDHSDHSDSSPDTSDGIADEHRITAPEVVDERVDREIQG